MSRYGPQDIARAALAIRAREEREALGQKYDWYGGVCPCGVPLGECKEHPRARPNQRPPGIPHSALAARQWDVWLISAGRGFGKMLDLETPIPTPEGWKKMGGLEVGDRVFDESGRPCQVTFVSDVEVPDDAYRLHFSDGSTIDACSEHQWVTWDASERKAFLRSPYEHAGRFPAEWPSWRLKRRAAGHPELGRDVISAALEMNAAGISAREIGRRMGISRQAIARHLRAGRIVERGAVVCDDSPGPRIRTTLEIIRTLEVGTRCDTNHCIPNCGPLELPDADLAVPPYALGVWLGDGDSKCGTITCHQDDQPEIREHLEGLGIPTTDRSDPEQFGTIGLQTALRLEGVLGNKHVPSRYLRASSRQRLELLRGLMDTDGGNEGGSSVSFTNTRKCLADAVYELAVSLGMKATRDSRVPVLEGKECRLAHRVTFTPTMQVFRLCRKSGRVRFDVCGQLKRHHRMIVGAERIAPRPMRCISVDSRHSTYLCGRGMVPTHNTRSGAEFVRQMVETGRWGYVALINETVKDVRDVQIEGPGGLLENAPPWFRPLYEPSKARVTWPNGATATIYSAEQPGLLRGPQFHGAWPDEIGKWKYNQQETWDMLQFGLRLGPRPQVVATTTPRPSDFFSKLLRHPRTAVSTGSTFENAAHMPAAFLDRVREQYEGTRLGRQELFAELLMDTPGALWTTALLDDPRCRHGVPKGVDLVRVVVGVDPSIGSGDPESGAEAGIVVSGRGSDRRGYVLEDASLKGSPERWGARAIRAYHDHKADVLAAEANNGGDMVEAVIRALDPSVKFKKLWASRGKIPRAEPVAALYEKGVVSHVQAFPDLERQMTSYVPGDPSPDRMDAAVWSLTESVLDFLSPGRAEAGGNPRVPYSPAAALARGPIPSLRPRRHSGRLYGR